MADRPEPEPTAADEGMMGAPSTPQANRAAMKGGGVGQREMDAQDDPNRAANPDAVPAPADPDGEDDSRDGDGV